MATKKATTTTKTNQRTPVKQAKTAKRGGDPLAGLEDLALNPGKQAENMKKYEEKRKSFSGSGFYKFKEGETLVRILPPIEEDGIAYRAVKFHYMNGHTVYSRNTINEQCPISRYASMVWKKFKETEEQRYKDFATNLFAKEKFLFNAAIRGETAEEDQVVVLDAGKTFTDMFINLMNDVDYGDITCPVKGRDLKVVRKGKRMDTKYTIQPKSKKSLLAGSIEDPENAKEEIKNMLEMRKDLEEIVQFPTYEEAEAELKEYLSIEGDILNFYDDVKTTAPVMDDSDEEDAEENESEYEDDDDLDDVDLETLNQIKKGTTKSR